MWTALKQLCPSGGKAEPGPLRGSPRSRSWTCSRAGADSSHRNQYKRVSSHANSHCSSHPHCDLVCLKWLYYFPLIHTFFGGGLFIYFKSILMYTGKTEKKILYFDLFGLCPRMKNCISPVNFYVKTILHQCNVSKKSSTLVQFLCFPSLASIATNFTEGSLHDRL